MPRYFRHISASALQFGINQAAGLGLFYLLSRGLDKDHFGELNWSLAVSFTAINLLGMGLDQLAVKKIAQGAPDGKVLSLYRRHVLTSGALFYGIVLIGWACFPRFFQTHYFLAGITLAKTILFFSMPYKQLAAGKERFGILMKMSIVSNVIKLGAVGACFLLDSWSVGFVIGIFVAGDTFEWIASTILGLRLLEGPREWTTLTAWRDLMRESLPQAGVVLFSTAMARFDWIFIGLFVSAAKLAEYSFAYKGFEVASLPLQVLAPLLLPAFARRFGAMEAGDPANTARAGAAAKLQRLLTIELLTAWGIFLVMNLLWSPWIDALTQGRYGHVNARTVFWLSLVLPVYFLNNFLWTIHFAQGRLTWIFKAFLVGFAINVAGDLILIPLYGNEGAAVAYLLAMAAQTLLYHKGIREISLTRAWVTLLAGGGVAGLLLWAATR